VLEEIAADQNAAPTLRYRAASRLLSLRQRAAVAGKMVPNTNGEVADADDPVTRLALQRMRLN
jgi:hypothetical protein